MACNWTAAAIRITTSAIAPSRRREPLFALFEVTARKDDHRCHQQDGDVEACVGGRHQHVTKRDGLGVDDLCLDVELSEVRQNPVQPSSELGGGRRVDNLFEV